MNEIGKAIRIVRQAKGLTLGRVAKGARVSIPFLSLVERGERSPSMSTLRRIASALEIPFDALVLLGQPSEGRLVSEDSASERLAKSIRKLASVEAELSELLAK